MFTTNWRDNDESTERPPARTLTLLDLVSELVDAGWNDREVVTAVMDLVETHNVRLVGQVCEADLGFHS